MLPTQDSSDEFVARERLKILALRLFVKERAVLAHRPIHDERTLAKRTVALRTISIVRTSKSERSHAAPCAFAMCACASQ